MDTAAVTVRQERCAKVRNRNVSCLRCADACTSGCISLVDGELVVDAARCVGCGTCATVCPTCALESRNPSDAQLLASCVRALRDGEAVIMCEQLRCAVSGLIDEGRVASVVCLGRVEESLVVELAVRGARCIHLACGECSRCAQAHGLDCARLVAGTAGTLLEAWGSAVRICIEQGVPADLVVAADGPAAADGAVAAYFSNGSGNRATAAPTAAPAGSGVPPSAARPLPHVMKDGTLPHFLPDRRERLLNALALLGGPRVGSLSVRLWGRVAIDGRKCSSCRMCATFCPTGAIRKFDRDGGADGGGHGTFGVEHRPADCVKCGSCRDICPEGALTVFDDVRTADLTDGTSHRHTMRPRSVELGSAQQILSAMRHGMDASVFER
jgi:ferredoxin